MLSFNKKILKLLSFASEPNIRPTLSWLYIKNWKVAATDSFKLVEFPLVHSSDDSIIPLEWFNPIKNEDIENWIIIPKDFFKKIKFWKLKWFDWFENCVLWNYQKKVENDLSWSDKISWFTSELESSYTCSTRLINNNKFPEYEQWFKTWEDSFTFWVSAEFLKQIMEAYISYWIRWVHITVNAKDNLQPIIITWDWYIEWKDYNWNSLEWKDFRSIVMPLKIN